MYTLKIEGTFEAAHRIIGHSGKCDRLHGHSWRVEVQVCGTKQDALGMVIDFKYLKEALAGILNEMDHHYLNELPSFQKQNPTAENLSRVIYEALKAQVHNWPEVQLRAVTVWESPTASVTYTEET